MWGDLAKVNLSKINGPPAILYVESDDIEETLRKFASKEFVPAESITNYYLKGKDLHFDHSPMSQHRIFEEPRSNGAIGQFTFVHTRGEEEIRLYEGAITEDMMQSGQINIRDIVSDRSGRFIPFTEEEIKEEYEKLKESVQHKAWDRGWKDLSIENLNIGYVRRIAEVSGIDTQSYEEDLVKHMRDSKVEHYLGNIHELFGEAGLQELVEVVPSLNLEFRDHKVGSILALRREIKSVEKYLQSNRYLSDREITKRANEIGHATALLKRLEQFS